ncbi:hypothetical protein [uncultured Pseudoteredinibacter sp.]|uniref:hypothetical protein n=1 Tax=uncultured Pseudoteredinibacter sp. TaxID=1641701 RepID=UPI002623A4C2|nr:hypothetical protein [uncultured Pseudoteredinibacter sp.]
MLQKPLARTLFVGALLSSSFVYSGVASTDKSSAPHLSGQLKVSIENGTIDANISISNIPRSKDHSFQLNTGLNIKGITSEDGSVNFAYRRTSLEQFYESFAYTIPSDAPNELYQPKALNFRYSGKYPVYGQAFKARSDWKGNIAFNGKSLRVDGMQTAILPIYYDKLNDRLYKDVSYDIQIDCVDCKSLFINGSTPVRAFAHRFVSEHPVEPMMFLGDFDFIELGGNRVLNPLVKKDHIEQGLSVVAQYKSLLSKWFDQPLTNGITFIQTTPVSEKNSWLWVSGSTIVSISHDYYALDRLFSEEGDARFKAHDFIAHELAHVLFNSYPGLQGELSNIIEEGMAEYLSWSLVSEFNGKRAKQYLLDWRREKLEDKKLKPLIELSLDDEFFQSNSFRYNVLPLIIHSMETIIGKEQVIQWMQSLATREKSLNPESFLSSIESAINNPEQYEHLAQKVDW